jgi:hypothetical protein
MTTIPADPPIYIATVGDDVIEFGLDLAELLDRVAAIHETSEDVVIWLRGRALLVLIGGGRRIDPRNPAPEADRG